MLALAPSRLRSSQRRPRSSPVRSPLRSASSNSAASRKVTGGRWSEQRLVVFGAGTAGTGMADQIHAAMVRDGATPAQAKSNIWLVDIHGLVTDDMADLPDYQQVYARPRSEVSAWADGEIDLLTTVRHVKPTILIGTSTQPNAFTEDIVRALAEGTERPILLPLSNPTSRIEVMPSDAVGWAEGRALIAVGIPVEPVSYNGTSYEIGQANNALLYPGLGLGAIVSGARHVTDNMLLAAAEAVAGQVDVSQPGASLLPPVSNLRASSATVAVAVARAAERDGVATKKHENLIQAVQDAMWQPVYPTNPVENEK
ncbi:oxaloacetate-decarboxylating malate dehydrogenase [Streptomyces sp. NBC_01190]|nr:oxaloacetate-decarboxylating malate dehydrogenase [Streptomyces sp. NBC_01190]